MAWETVRLNCAECGHTFEELMDRSQRDAWHSCPACGETGSARRIMAAPHIRTSDSASFLDGTKRFGRLREKREIERAIAGTKDKNTISDLKKEKAKVEGKT